MMQRHIVEIDGKRLREFKYTNPLGKPGDAEDKHEVLAYFDAETMALDRIMYRKNDTTSMKNQTSVEGELKQETVAVSPEDMFNPFTLYAP